MSLLIMKSEYIKTQQYWKWLCNILNKHTFWTTQSISCVKDLELIDVENTQKLFSFYNYIQKLAKQQYIIGKDNTYIFKLNQNFYEISSLQNPKMISVMLMTDENIEDFVKVDEPVLEEEIKERELIQYIIINKDLLGKISDSKIGIHIGHACTIVAIEQGDTDEFKEWYQNSKLQKKVVLTAPQKKLEELEKDFYSVRDLGFTQVKNGTLIAVSLGIMTRKKAKKYIKRLQTWK